MRYWLFVTAIFGIRALAGGFVMEKGRIYTKTEFFFESADAICDSRGHRNSDPDTSGIEEGMDTSGLSIYAAFGVTERLTASLSTQYLDMTFKTLFGEDLSQSGFSDVWLLLVHEPANVSNR